MKKYLLPLILIFVLLFVSIGDCAWLSGYDKRIKLTTDNTKVDSTLSNFPVTVFFTSTQAEEIFTEFDADANYMKCAFTQSDGTTQLYAEKELFDVRKSQYPTAHSDTYVKSTTKASTNYWAYFTTDPAKSLTGTYYDNAWLSSANTNQRFHIDLGSAKIIKKIYYENSHSSGTNTDTGAQNFTFWGSNTGAGSFDDLVYANDGGWTQLTCSQNTFDQHTGSNVADPKYITVTNTTGYRYYAFKFADNYGDASNMGVRRIELQGCGEAVYHVKVTSISSSTGTDIYYYYNNSIADNTTYIGAINTTAGGTVWDANFKAVYHMVDATTSTVVDSTSNNNDTTKAGAGNPEEATGKVGQGQDFSGDYLTHATFLDSMPNNLTIEAVAKFDTINSIQYIFNKSNVAGQDRIGFDINSSNYLYFWGEAQNGGSVSVTSSGTVAAATWYYLAGVHTNGSALKNYINTTETSGSTLGNILDGTDADVIFGSANTTPQYSVDGIMDEIRVSGTNRTAAWLKATYNTLWDTFLTYGSEEDITVIDIGSTAEVRGYYDTTASTMVDKNNPANGTGTITSVEIYAESEMVNCEVATFYITSETKELSTRDWELVGTVNAGHNQFNVNIDVEAGDYIGLYYPSGYVHYDKSGGGLWHIAGDYIPCTTQEFTILVSDRMLSIYGSGTTAEDEGNAIFFGFNF